MIYSAGIVEHYINNDCKAVIMEWNDSRRYHPEWKNEWRYFPQHMVGTDNRKIALTRANLSTLIALPVHCYVAIKISECTTVVGEFIRPILLAMINTGIMMSAVFGVKNYLFVKVSFVQFFVINYQSSNLF